MADRQVVSDDEDVLFASRPSWTALTGPTALASALGAGVVAGFVLWRSAPLWFGWLLLATIVFAALVVAVAVVKWRATILIVTSARVVYRSGILRRLGREIPVESVQDVTFDQSLFERLAHAGSVTVESAGDRGALPFLDVARPNDFQEAVNAAVARARGRGSAPPPRIATIPEQIAQLAELYRQGVLTESEFTAKKGELLAADVNDLDGRRLRCSWYAGPMPGSYWIETLGCPKNQVDSDKLAGSLLADGYIEASGPDVADVLVVNTCAFIEPARAESVETILNMHEHRRPGSRLVVTGCLAARAGQELADALPEVDVVTDVGVPVELALGPRRAADRFITGGAGEHPSLDLLEMPRRPAAAPWAYVKVAEGCDRKCGFCAIPSFRGPQRSRPVGAVLDEVDALVAGGVREIVLVSQDLASYGRDRGIGRATDDEGATGRSAIIDLVGQVAARADAVRLLYLYPSSLTEGLIDAIVATGLSYFDLSLQHVSSPMLRRMRRFGSSARFLERIASIREKAPDAALRSSFILGYPGETEEDHDELLGFLAAAELDWAGFFTFSNEAGTYAASLEDHLPTELALERLRECAELQDAITAKRRVALVGTATRVLVDAPGVGRSHREAPEIDGIIQLPTRLETGRFYDVEIVAANGPDLVARPLSEGAAVQAAAVEPGTRR